MGEKVVILLSTYNGEKYLEEQLNSLFNQSYPNIFIYVRDDGSTDRTISILNKYKKLKKLDWYEGKNLKPAKSFMDLLYKAPKADYYAFCDQDDFWLEDKIEIAINKLKKCKKDIPVLYYGMPRLVDRDLNPIYNTNVSKEKFTSFKESLITSNAIGCTFVFNYKLLSLLINRKIDDIIMHDAWIHKVCLALDGKIIYDEDVHILYRQHSNNVMGMSNTLFKKMIKRIKLLKKEKKNHLKMIKSIYNNYHDFMNQNNKELCLLLLNYDKNIMSKIKVLFSNRIKTKYMKRNILFKFMIIFNYF